ncbi:hypothetical protein C7974DRAFT_422221 [Boeremia exigua]|uniref:uncharacterized protein n=1 Tax=Boeremia exigua TaxID=749465 RepID=UPI001E8E0925|nr:uncharacterized protein C7974DRAFT_422221 [Boeremia exigua]KAH6639701.1 hypothetical protein C7974DRAFT_422221 [Boeremia exigua]
MGSRDIIDKKFIDGFNEALDLFNADRLVECESALFALLNEETMPRYHRMKVLILLGTIVGDWEEASRYHVAADAMWHIARSLQPEGADEEAEKHFAELRESLDELDAVLKDDAPSEYRDDTAYEDDSVSTVEDDEEEHDAGVEDIHAEMNDLKLDNTPALPSVNSQAPMNELHSSAKDAQESEASHA